MIIYAFTFNNSFIIAYLYNNTKYGLITEGKIKNNSSIEKDYTISALT